MSELSIASSRIYGEAAFEVLAKAKELERKGRDIIHFEIGEPDIETPKNIVDSAINAIKNKKTHYEPSIGILELRKTIQDEIEKTRGYRPELEQVVNQRFDLIVRKKQLKYEEMLKKLQKFQQEVETRQAELEKLQGQKDKAVTQRLEELVSDAEKVNWD